MTKKTIVIDLGGSILTPEIGKINLKLLKKFKEIIKKASQNKRFIIVVGGGSLARNYQNAVRNLKISDNDLDWIGIRSTQLNAETVRTYFGTYAHPEICLSEEQKITWTRNVLISGGWQPGNSTDYVALKLAERFRAEKVIIATNIDYIYDSDPEKNHQVKKITNIAWKDFGKIFDNKWQPGMKTPFDPKAVRLGKKIKIPLYFVNGSRMTNFEKILAGKDFKGTSIT